MAEQKRKTGLLAKMRDRFTQVHEEKKDEPIRTSGGAALPGNIRGIAQINQIYLAEFQKGDNKGMPYVMGKATVHEPKEHAGSFTFFGPEPLFDTEPKQGQPKYEGLPYSFEEHFDQVLNVLKMAGVDVSEVSSDDPDEALDAWCEEACRKKQFIKFYTKQKAKRKPDDPEPKVYHTWSGPAEDYKPAGTLLEVEDNTAAPTRTTTANRAPVKQGTQQTNGTAKAATRTAPAKTAVKEEPEEIEGDTPPGSVDEVEGVDLDALAEAADSNDENEWDEADKARKQLTRMAEDLGIDVKKGSKFDKANSWTDAARIIRKVQKEAVPASEEEELVEEEADSETPYGIGDHAQFKPLIEKDGKRFKGKAVQVEVLSVNSKNGTVTLKSMVDGKPINGPDKKPLAVKVEDLIAL